MKTIIHDDIEYPHFQAEGHASQFILPFAKRFCSGKGVDVGCMKWQWAFPGSWPVDINFDDGFHAMNLPMDDADYIFSSHCLEHLHDWVGVLDYWTTCIRPGGVIFLYLPHYSQTYWRPWNNRKHVNILTPEYLKDYFEARKFSNVWVTGPDLNNAFCAVGVKNSNAVKE